MRIILPLLVFFFLIPAVSAWFSDPGNDSCLVASFDSQSYSIDRYTSKGEMVIMIENNCGHSIQSAIASIQIDKKNFDGFQAISIEQGPEPKIFYEKNYLTCPYYLSTKTAIASGVNSKTATCVKLDENKNGKNEIVFVHDFNSIDGKTIEYLTPKFDYSLTKILPPDANQYLPVDVNSFLPKKAWAGIAVPKGISFLRISFAVPKKSAGEFAFSIVNDQNTKEFSMVDPSWWLAGEITPDAHTIALWHFNDNAGTSANDAGTNNYDMTLSNANIWDATTKKWGVSSISPNNLYYGTQTDVFDSPTANWTTQFWIAPITLYDATVATYEILFDRCDGVNKRISCMFPPSSGTLYCYIETAAGEKHVISDITSWAQDEWRFIQLIYDGTNLKMRIDGVLQDSIVSPNVGTWDGEFVVGANFVYGNKSLFRMDDFEIADVDRNATPNASPSLVLSDLNVFAWDDLTKNIDLNIFSDTNVVFDFNAYGANQDPFSIKVFDHSVTPDSNCFGSVRETVYCGWHKDEPAFSLIEGVGDLNHYRSATEDDHVFKMTATNLDPDFLKDSNAWVKLNSPNVWFKLLLTNAKKDSNVFTQISFDANFTGSPSRTLLVYDCNSDVSDPITNVGCNIFSFSTSSVKDPDNFYSIRYISNDKNQLVGDKNVNMNLDGNHWIFFNSPVANSTHYWTLRQVDQNSNINRVRQWNSTAGTGAFSALAQTARAHLHWSDLKQANYFDYIIQISSAAADDFNSAMQRIQLLSGNLPPKFNYIVSPLEEGVYNGILDINVSVSDPNQDYLVMDINLLNDLLEPIATIAFNLSDSPGIFGGMLFTTSFDTTVYPDSTYYLYFRVRETLTAQKYSRDRNYGPFLIDNIPAAIPPQKRFFATDDPRKFETTSRFFSEDDPRGTDTNQFYSPEKTTESLKPIEKAPTDFLLTTITLIFLVAVMILLYLGHK